MGTEMLRRSRMSSASVTSRLKVQVPERVRTATNTELFPRLLDSFQNDLIYW